MGRISHQAIKTKVEKTLNDEYGRFDQLDGSHSWQTKVPDGCVLYPARKLNAGEVLYFNFSLAQEMGLIPEDHPHTMSKKLQNKILDTFSIRILNEYDQRQNVKYMPTLLKKHPYMATRYLQLQHKNKTGKTSGDGRSIWNGEIEHNGTIWDVSSRGTGVTQLAPGAVEAQKPLRSGDTSFGYGCGLADIDELIGAAIMAEIFHNNNINTERVLTIIDLGKGNGIGVRAGKNLFRPAHLFTHLKQGQLDSLQRATDYLIDRQHQNGEWTFGKSNKRKYDLMLQEISESFAFFSAQLDREYIFAWLDWDGDNVLVNSGIIDYGSIRQFGLRHDEYRYDDVDRFSTNLHEQKFKARQIVQTFAQLVDYINTGSKKPVRSFLQHPSVLAFDEHFQYYLHDQFLHQLGYPRMLRENLLRDQRGLVQRLYSKFSALERMKTRKKRSKVSDGVNRPAILNMRVICVELPDFLLHSHESGTMEPLPEEIFFELAIADSATGRDRKLSPTVKKRIRDFQNCYCELLLVAAKDYSHGDLLAQVCEQANQVNRPDRMTGDGLLHIVDELIKFMKKTGHGHLLQQAIEQLIADQSPSATSADAERGPKLHASHRGKTLIQTLLSLVDGFKESI